GSCRPCTCAEIRAPGSRSGRNDGAGVRGVHCGRATAVVRCCEEGEHPRSALGLPGLRRLQTLLTRLGQVELFGAPVGCRRLCSYINGAGTSRPLPEREQERPRLFANEAHAPTAEMAETPPSIKKSAPTTYAESSDTR